jgi:hypothetical protein
VIKGAERDYCAEYQGISSITLLALQSLAMPLEGLSSVKSGVKR